MLARLKLPAELDGNVWRYVNAAEANRRHHHAELELNLITAGEGTYLLGSRRYTIRRGDLLWLFPAQEHVLVEQSGDFAMWVAVFRRRAVKRLVMDESTRPLLERRFRGDSCRKLGSAEVARLEELFVELASAGEAGLMNAGLGYALLRAWKCFQHAAAVPVRELHPAIEHAAGLLGGNGVEYGLEELSRKVGLSPSRLSRLFKEQTGTTIVNFRNRRRMEKFQHVYGSGMAYTLLEAALEAGFGSYVQFHRVCRNLLGCSPQEYARRATWRV